MRGKSWTREMRGMYWIRRIGGVSRCWTGKATDDSWNRRKRVTWCTRRKTLEMYDFHIFY